MQTRAAVAWTANAPLSIETVELAGPKAGEVLVEIMATGVCHTDAYTLSGLDSEGLFPAILGHEGAGVVREVGAGVTSVRPGDHVIPLYTPECRAVQDLPVSQRSNLCTAIRSTQGQGRDARRHQPLLLRRPRAGATMPCSTTWAARPSRISPCCRKSLLAKVREDAPFDKICYIGCGVTTGVGAVIYTGKVWPGANVVVFGLGGIGLNVIQGARMVGADKIIGVDLNPAKAEMAKKFGMTDYINPKDVGRPGQGGGRRSSTCDRRRAPTSPSNASATCIR